METLAVVIIIALASGFLVRTFYKRLQGGGCGCGTSSCSNVRKKRI